MDADRSSLGVCSSEVVLAGKSWRGEEAGFEGVLVSPFVMETKMQNKQISCNNTLVGLCSYCKFQFCSSELTNL